MGDRSLKVYEFYKDSVQKYEYFITGLIGAVFSYNAQNILPQKLGFNPSTGQILSLVFLCTAFIISLKRLKMIEYIYRLNHTELYLLEKKGSLKSKENNPYIINEETGDVFNNEQIIKMINSVDKQVPKITEQLEKTKAQANSLYIVREYFLYAGFVLLIIMKIWTAYQ